MTARKADLATDAILKLLPVSRRLKQLLTELGEEEGPAD